MKKNKEKQLVIKPERRPLKEAPFTVLPKAVFYLRRNHNTRRSSLFRLLLTTCYFYSKAMTEDLEARITYSELMKILDCKSMNSITTILTLLEDSLIIADREYDPHKKQSTIILSHPTVIAERVQSAIGIKVRENIIFKFPKILLLLPISPQAKTILLYLYSKKNYPEDWEVPVTGKEIMKHLKLKKETVFKALKELYDKGLITEVGKQNKLTIVKIIPPILVDKENKPSWYWDKKLVHSAFMDFPTHPFWKLYIDNQLINPEEIILSDPNMETKIDQYGTDGDDNLTNMEPIPHQYGTHQTEQELLLQSPQASLEDYIEEEIIEDYIDDIYNGGVGVKKECEISSKETFNSNEKKKGLRNNCSKENQHSKSNSFPKEKNVSSQNKEILRKSTKLCEQSLNIVEDLDSQHKSSSERERIEKIVECIENKIPEYIFSRLTVQEDWLTALEKFYSKRTARFLALAYMYLLGNTKAYSNIKNPVGFLISFADENRVPDFKEFLQRFLIYIGHSHIYKVCVEKFYSSKIKQPADEVVEDDCLERAGTEEFKAIDSEDDLDTFEQTPASKSSSFRKPQVEKVKKKDDVEKEQESYKAVVLDNAKLVSLYLRERKSKQGGGVKAFSNLLEQESMKSGECPEDIRSSLDRKFDSKLVYYVLPENTVKSLEEVYKHYWGEVVIGVINYKLPQRSVVEF